MATEAQIRANRANAQKSTGPRTEDGKNASKFNALTHGLAASQLILREEHAEDLDRLRAKLQSDYLPFDETESMFVEEMAQCWFRLQRARAHETQALDIGFALKNPYAPVFMNALRYANAAERGFHRAVRHLHDIQAERRRPAQDVVPAEAPQPAESAPQPAPAPAESAQPAPSAQPTEKLKVMTVGSVLQTPPDHNPIGSVSYVSPSHSARQLPQEKLG